MGELANDWALYKRIKKEERDRVEPSRVEYATNKLMKIGCTVAYNAYAKAIFFNYGTIKGKLYPFTGWYSAKGIGDGRGIRRLVKKLQEYQK